MHIYWFCIPKQILPHPSQAPSDLSAGNTGMSHHCASGRKTVQLPGLPEGLAPYAPATSQRGCSGSSSAKTSLGRLPQPAACALVPSEKLRMQSKGTAGETVQFLASREYA